MKACVVEPPDQFTVSVNMKVFLLSERAVQTPEGE
jgi:hypothetical protein